LVCRIGRYPQCCLRLAKFKRTDKSEFLDNRHFYGNAFELLLKAERFLTESLPIAGRVIAGVFERIDEPLYPRVALREALANAFCHRDYANAGGSISIGIYQDRLEVASTGGLHFGLTADKLFQPHESLPWNPLISRIFYRRGVIEAWGGEGC
jgi:ATP-dependent DNA helicase RecG